MLVSFIIPAYNAVDTIARCLDSIYALSLKREEFEVIVVDDASSDNTCEIVEQYAQQLANDKMSHDKSLNEPLTLNDGNLVLLRQPENHRQGAARNAGVKIAKGEYICFVDADDAVAEGIVKAIRIAKEKKVDMTILHYTEVNENKGTSNEGKCLNFAEGEIFAGIEMQNKYPYWCSAPWGYIYDKEFLKRVNYPFAEDVLYEDTDFIMIHLYHAKRTTYSPELGYVAYYREGSITRSFGSKHVADYLLLGVRMLRFYDSIIESQESTLTLAESQELEKFAEGILEGACYNVAKACKNLMKLRSTKEVKAFYERVDGRVNRKKIDTEENIRKYYWNMWTALCLRHKQITIAISTVLIPMYKLVQKCKV